MVPDHPSQTVVFASNDRPFATGYLNILAEKGFKSRYVPLDELQSLASDRPGLLLIYDNRPYRRFAHIPIDEKTLDAFRLRTKIIAFGAYGADFLGDLDQSSMLSMIAHSDKVEAVLDDPQRPHDIAGDLPKDRNIALYQPSDGAASHDIVAAYDAGSTALQNVIGLARQSGAIPRDPCSGAHWSVALGGNYALWGYPRHAALLTDAGRTLFTDLATYMLKTGYSEAGGSAAETLPGTFHESLGCGAQSRRFPFHPTGPGPIRAEIQASAPVALMLNAPTSLLVQRKDANSSIVEHELTADDLKLTGRWVVSLTYFGTVTPATSISYTLKLDYPASKAQHWIWLIIGGIAVLVAAFAIIRLLFIARARGRGAAQAPQPVAEASGGDEYLGG
jgi:hypothetical protein